MSSLWLNSFVFSLEIEIPEISYTKFSILVYLKIALKTKLETDELV